jgi:hypothetical protein
MGVEQCRVSIGCREECGASNDEVQQRTQQHNATINGGTIKKAGIVASLH